MRRIFNPHLGLWKCGQTRSFGCNILLNYVRRKFELNYTFVQQSRQDGKRVVTLASSNVRGYCIKLILIIFDRDFEQFPFRFFPLVLMYFIIGVLINRYGRGIQSMPELIPNHSFWADFPFLVKVNIRIYYILEFWLWGL